MFNIAKLSCAAAVCCLALTAPAVRAAEARPNVVFVLVDDLRYNGLGCTGHPFAKTPNIDRLAREGVNFDNTFVTLSLCSPSRACFLTGRYAHSHGVTDNRDHDALSHQLLTFPRLLHDAGYRTAFIGKWHMGNDDSPRPGFDRWVSFKGQGVYEDPGLNVDGQRVKRSGYITDILTDEALAFLARGSDKPFLLYLSHKAVHGPFTPATRHKDLYAGDKVQPPPSAGDTLDGKPALRRELEEHSKKKKGHPSHAAIEKDQIRSVAAIDEGLGRVLAALETSGQLDNTCVIFTSDNGYLWGDHGLGDKRAPYEPSIRIPMLMRYPKLARAGAHVTQMALNIDVAPTVLDLAGVSVPREVEGHSLLPLLRGETSNWRTSFYCEYFLEPNNPRIPTWQGIRAEGWKLVHYPGLEGMDELYDLAADPNEMVNLVDKPAAASALASLRAELSRAAPGPKTSKP